MPLQLLLRPEVERSRIDGMSSLVWAAYVRNVQGETKSNPERLVATTQAEALALATAWVEARSDGDDLRYTWDGQAWELVP